MKKALLIIANNGFQDWEYYYPRNTLENEGFDIDIASSQKWTCKGKLDEISAEANKTLNEVNLEEYEMIVFVWGPWVPNEFDNDENYIKIFENSINANKTVWAICIAPTVLSKSSYFNWKKVTWFDAGKWEQIETIKNNWGNYTWEDVEVDQNFVTAIWPNAAEEFANKLVEVHKSY